MTTPIQSTSPSSPTSPTPTTPRATQLQQRKLASVLCAISFISIVLFSACVATAITSGYAVLWILPVCVALIFVLSALAIRRLCPKSVPMTKVKEPSKKQI